MVENWLPTATGCSGVIRVSDPKGLLVPNSADMYSSVRVVDPLTGGEIPIVYLESGDGLFPFSSVSSEGYAFSCTGLKPDQEYLLLVDAPINTNMGSGGPYVRNFITKIFYTDSVGVYLEAEPSAINAVNVSVRAQNYAGTINNLTVYLYTSESAAAAATAAAPGGYAASLPGKVGEALKFDSLDGGTLSSNTTYYARVVANVSTGDGAPGAAMMPAQVLPLTTLKQEVVLGAPIMTSNRTSWGFDITPGTIQDTDGGVVTYRYEFYEADENGDAALDKGIAKTVDTKSTNSLTIPLDYGGAGLQAGLRYVVRLVATFNDNEKTYEISSGFSNAAAVTGGELPNVVYINNGDPDYNPAGGGSGASGTAGWYDQLAGVVRVIPGTKGSRLMLGNGRVPKLTIRAPGYYYVSYPVYLEDELVNVERGKYLVGTVHSDGTVDIGITETLLDNLKKTNGSTVASDGSGAVNGLRPGTAFRLIVSGYLSDDGNNSTTDRPITVGVCVVETPKLEWVTSTLSYEETAGRETLKNSVLTLFSQKDTNGDMSAQLRRQQATLTSLKLEALENAGSQNPLSTVDLTESGYKNLLYQAAQGLPEGPEKTEFTDALTASQSLGEIVEKGIPLTQALFQTSTPGFDLTQKSAVFIKVSAVMDYTGLSFNKDNQNSYRPSDPNNPDDNLKNYDTFYTNQYTLRDYPDGVMDSTKKAAPVAAAAEGLELIYDIQLGATPDPIPEAGKGVIVTPLDTDNDTFADDAYRLEANYANGSRLARYITYYVFDAPDWNMSEIKVNEDHITNWEWATDGYKFDEASFPLEQDPLKYGTPVSELKDGKGLWLAKLRIPVPLTGAFANQMPKVEFIPQTAEAYFGAGTAGLQAYKDSLATIPAVGAPVNPNAYVPDNNTWRMFYPEGSTEPRTGHQFVFVWTMEYEQTVNGAEKRQYYPFEYSGYATGTAGLGHYKNIPHSAVIDAPHRQPTIYAIPWTTDRTTPDSPVVTWKMYVSDPDKAVVLDGAAAGTAKLYQRVSGTADATLVNGPATGAPAPEVPVDFTKLKTGERPTAAHDVSILVQTQTSKGPVQTALRVQYYTDKYTKNNTSLFNTGNSYRPSTIANHRGLETNTHAFTFNYDPASFPDSTQFGNVTLTIDTPDQSEVINQYNVKVTGPEAAMKTLNGVRLTFKGKDMAVSGQPEKSIVLDKYVECVVDQQVSGGQWIETEGGNMSYCFRVYIPQELGELAGQTVDFSAQLIYEDGHEGFGYAIGTAQPLSLTWYDSSSMASTSRRWNIFRGTGTPALAVTTGNDKAPRVGSFFTMDISPANFSWPEEVMVYSTRAALWTMQNWSTENNKIELKYDEASSASRYMPRRLDFRTMDKVSGNAFETGTKIKIPTAVPIITYGSASGYANYIDVPHSVNQALDGTGGGVYFALERYDANAGGDHFVLQKFTVDQDGIYKWADVDTGDMNNSAYIGSLNLNSYSGLLQNEAYEKANEQKNFSFLNLESGATYRIRAYYWDSTDNKFKLMNMPTSSGIVDENLLRVNTEGAPQVMMTVRYNASSYDYKFIQTSVQIPRLTSYYYTLELQDISGKFITYLDAISNRTTGREGKSGDLYFVGDGAADLGNNSAWINHGVVNKVNEGAGAFVIENENTPNSYPKLGSTAAGRQYLEYGKQYQVRVRLYNIGSGPAYGGNTGTDLLQGSASAVQTFTVTKEEDAVSTTGNFDLKVKENGKDYDPTVSFTLNPVTRSGRLRYDMMTAVVVRARTTAGVTEYQDVTDQLTGSLAETLWKTETGEFVGLLNRQRQTMELNLSSTEYQVGDEFYFYLYGIMDDADSTTTQRVGNKPNTVAAQKDYRETVLDRRPHGNGNILSPADVSQLRSETGIAVNQGHSVLLSWGRASYISADASAGQINLTKSGDSVRVDMINPVKVTDVKYAQWSITATYTAGGQTRTIESGLQEQELNFTAGGSPQFIMNPVNLNGNNFNIPSDATDVLYTVTMRFFKGKDGSGKLTGSVPMTAASSNLVVSSSGSGTDIIYTLSGTLEMRGSGASGASLRSILALLPDDRKRGQ